MAMHEEYPAGAFKQVEWAYPFGDTCRIRLEHSNTTSENNSLRCSIRIPIGPRHRSCANSPCRCNRCSRRQTSAVKKDRPTSSTEFSSQRPLKVLQQEGRHLCRDALSRQFRHFKSKFTRSVVTTRPSEEIEITAVRLPAESPAAFT